MRLTGDASANNTWNNNNMSILDIQINHPYCKSNVNKNIENLLEQKEKAKKHKCMARCKEYWLNFIPCIASTTFILGQEFSALLTIIAKRLESKWDKNYALTKNYVNFRIHMAVIKGVVRCTTGTRTKIMGHSFLSKDEEGIDLLMH